VYAYTQLLTTYIIQAQSQFSYTAYKTAQDHAFSGSDVKKVPSKYNLFDPNQ